MSISLSFKRFTFFLVSAFILLFFSGLLSTSNHFSLRFFMGTYLPKPLCYHYFSFYVILSFVQGFYMTPLWLNLPTSVDSQIHVSFGLTNLCPALNSKYAKHIFCDAPKIIKSVVLASFPFCVSISLWGTTIYMSTLV